MRAAITYCMSYQYHISEYGSGGERQLVIPGIASDPSDWEKLGEELEGQATLVVTDYPWHRKTVWEPDTSKRDKMHMQDMAVMFGDEGCTKIIAHSRGNLICINMLKELELMDEDLPTHVAMIAPPVVPVQEAMRLQMSRPMSKQAFVDPVRMLHVGLENELDEKEYAELLERHRDAFGSRASELLKVALDRSINPMEYVHAYAKRTTPTTIIGGVNDPLWNKQKLSETLTGKENIEVIELPSGHYPHRTHPDLVAAALSSHNAYQL